MTERPGRRALGAVSNIAVLERELGQVAYALHKARAAGAPDVDELQARRDGLVALLDAEHERHRRLHGA